MHRCTRLRFLHQHHRFPTDMGFIERLCLLVGQGQEHLATTMLFIGRHHMVDLQRLGPRTLRITEHMQLGNIQAFQKLVCLIEIFFRLATGTYNHIHTDEGMRHHFLDFLYLVSKQCRIITTTHQLQHLVATALQRDMEMRHERTRLGHIFNNFIGQQVRFDGRNAITLNSFHLIQFLDQIEESFTGRLTEISYIHSGNDNFLAPFGSCLAGLRHNVFNLTITASATGKRDGTIRTEIIATVLYLKEITGTVAPRTRRSKATDILESTGMRLSLVMLLQIAQIVHQFALLLRTQYHIHPLDGSHLFGFQLGIATGHYHKGSRMVLHQAMNGLTALLVGHLGNGTCIDNTDVRLFTLTHGTHSGFLQHLADGRSFREIQLAAQGVIGSLLILKYSSIYHISMV